MIGKSWTRRHHEYRDEIFKGSLLDLFRNETSPWERRDILYVNITHFYMAPHHSLSQTIPSENCFCTKVCIYEWKRDMGVNVIFLSGSFQSLLSTTLEIHPFLFHCKSPNRKREEMHQFGEWKIKEISTTVTIYTSLSQTAKILGDSEWIFS